MAEHSSEVRFGSKASRESQAARGDAGSANAGSALEAPSGGMFALPGAYLDAYREQPVAAPALPSGGQAESDGGALRAMTNGRAEGAHPGVKKGGKGKRRIGHVNGGSFVKEQGGGQGGAGGGGHAGTGHEGERAFVGDRTSGLADRTTTDGTTSVRMEDENDQQAAMIAAAVTRAREMLDHAIGRMGDAAGIQAALQANFHSTEDRTVSKVKGDLTRIRNAFNGTIPIEVEDEGEARAYVYIIWSDIHLCPPWFADGDADNRARTIIHECSHKYCGTDDKAYHWDTDKYAGLSTKDALNNADSYSWFCMDLR